MLDNPVSPRSRPLAVLALVAALIVTVGTAAAQPPAGDITHIVTLEPGVCPGVQTEITVQAGTTIWLCGSVTNTTNETIDFHTWSVSTSPDREPTPAFSNLRREVNPGETITNHAFGEEVGVESFNAETVTVTSTWTAVTASGREVTDSATAYITFEVPYATCRGVTATTVGTPGDDFGISGTPGDDVIAGLGGDDFIVGNGGNDLICGHDGNDALAGSLGDDRIYGGPGDDSIRGGIGFSRPTAPSDGDDVLKGGPGDDFIDGERGNDTVRGGRGVDTLEGGDGDDKLKGGPGDDTLQGQDGDDKLRGGRDTDECDGGPGIDKAVRCESIVGVP